jgi:methylated-DNA-protein-cysteine methyltransferase related protein
LEPVGRDEFGAKSIHRSRGEKKLTAREAARKLLKAPKSEQRDVAIRKAIRQIPRGKVATYGQVAAAAGYPLYHRQVVQVLRKAGGSLPWQRVVGAGGEIKFKYETASEQRFRLEMEGVQFRGKRVDMAQHQHVFRTWEFEQ